MYADILVSFQHVHAEEEGGPGGLSNLLKEEEKEGEEEKKKEGDEEEEEMEGKRMDEEEMQDIPGVEVGMMILLPLVSFPCSSCFKVLFSEKKLTNHKDLTSYIICCFLGHQITYHLPTCPARQHSATTVVRTLEKVQPV